MYAIICIDKPDSEALRLATRTAHVEHVMATPEIAAAGPFTSDDGAMMTGTLVLLNTDERAVAEAFAQNDPYHKAGLFASVEVKPWRHLLGGLPQA